MTKLKNIATLFAMENNSPNKVRTVRCPECGNLTQYSSENSFRPFCSERCRLIDLGQWADESYRVPDPDSSSVTLNDDEMDDEEV